MSSAFGHHTDDTPSTSDSMGKSRKGKFRNTCFLCKDMHLTYLFPRMDEASNLLENIIVPQERIPTDYRKLSLDLPLVDKVVDLVPSLVDPTLSLESEEQVVDPTLYLEIEVKVVDLMCYVYTMIPLFLGRYYVYAMKFVVSTLFRVMHFLHHGKIVTIDQLSFVKPDHCITPSH